MARDQAADLDLWRPGGKVLGHRGFIVKGVDEDEVKRTVRKGLCGNDGRLSVDDVAAGERLQVAEGDVIDSTTISPRIDAMEQFQLRAVG